MERTRIGNDQKKTKPLSRTVEMKRRKSYRGENGNFLTQMFVKSII